MANPQLEAQKSLVELVRRHQQAFIDHADRMKSDFDRRIDGDCLCDNCTAMFVLIEKAHELPALFRLVLRNMSEGEFICPDGTRARLDR